MELRSTVPLDLGKRFVSRQSRTVSAVGRHRVEAVRHDEEVRGERQILVADPVVARPVDALVMKLDRARLGGDELEALQ